MNRTLWRIHAMRRLPMQGSFERLELAFIGPDVGAVDRVAGGGRDQEATVALRNAAAGVDDEHAVRRCLAAMDADIGDTHDQVIRRLRALIGLVANRGDDACGEDVLVDRSGQALRPAAGAIVHVAFARKRRGRRIRAAGHGIAAGERDHDGDRRASSRHGASSSSNRRRPSSPSFSIVSRLRCTIASGSGYAATARSRLSSRSRCRVG